MRGGKSYLEKVIESQGMCLPQEKYMIVYVGCSMYLCIALTVVVVQGMVSFHHIIGFLLL